MKAISVKNPWAFAIAVGVKNIENRSWKTNFRGRVYIHTSKDTSLKDDVFTYEQRCTYPTGFPPVDFLAYGAIIGEVDIIDCVRDHLSIWAEKDCYNWVLANSKLYDQPILNVKGALSFWEFSPDEKKNIDHFFKNFKK